jgi:hypothetical protein
MVKLAAPFKAKLSRTLHVPVADMSQLDDRIVGIPTLTLPGPYLDVTGAGATGGVGEDFPAADSAS